jgi:hypothetical protein
MLHFCPIDPDGHIVAVVHCSEHTGVLSMSIVLVHTPLLHSVDMLLTVVQGAPNVPAAGASAVGIVGAVLVQAANASKLATRRRIAL